MKKKIERITDFKVSLLLIRAYQYLISPFLGNHCRYFPSCSNYAFIAISRFGFFPGFYLGIKRLIRCHPWHPGGIDPVPGKFNFCTKHIPSK